jgi:hypothetical protein
MYDAVDELSKQTLPTASSAAFALLIGKATPTSIELKIATTKI